MNYQEEELLNTGTITAWLSLKAELASLARSVGPDLYLEAV